MSTSSDTPHLQPCPCCHALTIASKGEYEICKVCGWEDDPVQSADPNYAGGANRLSLNQAKQEWSSTRKGQEG